MPDPTSLSMQDKLPLRMESTVVRGFGRGSSDLGIPTANLDRDQGNFAGGTFDELPTGIYWGFCRIGNDSFAYKTACSIGYNPTYDNTFKTVGKEGLCQSDDTEFVMYVLLKYILRFSTLATFVVITSSRASFNCPNQRRS